MRIGLLGSLEVRDGAGRPVRVGGSRARTLLIVLSLAPGRVVSASSLIDELWGADLPADAANALQTVVSRLRGALRGGFGPAVIESHPAGYRLAVDAEEVDAVAFETLARRGASELGRGNPAEAEQTLGEALRLWRGPALADVADLPFAAGESARLEELRLAAVQDRIEARLALGEAAAVIGELRSLVAASPLAERPRLLLMRALHATGRGSEALAVYAQGRELLASELGMDPSPRLVAAQLAVLRHQTPDDHAERAGASWQAPLRRPAGSAALNALIGRDDDVSGVLKKLAEDRLVTLTGPGGVGKTRLAVEIANRLDAWLVELAPVADPAEVPFAVLDALGVREPAIGRRTPGQGAASSPLDRLTNALAGHDAVLILDNCEHVIDVAARLASRLLAGCPRLRIVATSRSPLRISGEILWHVQPLGVPPAPPPPATSASAPSPAATSPFVSDISDIARYPAVRLLRERAQAVRPDFSLDAQNAAAVARICRALDGIPLAIELAAVWLRTLTADQLAGRLDDRFALLTRGSRAALPRHQTLRAVVDWSWGLLSASEQVLARRLSVFPAGATLEAAEQVCADSSLPAGEVLGALSGLVDKTILTVTAAGDAQRYRMLETVRAYCLERLDEAAERARVERGLIEYYLQLAETADPLLRTAQQLRWIPVLAAEQDNMHAALRWAITRGDVGTARRFARALGWYWMLSGHNEAEALAREVLKLPGAVDSLLAAEGVAIAAWTSIGSSGYIADLTEPLSRALDGLSRWQDQARGDETRWEMHPLAAMVEPLLALTERDPERAIELLGDPAALADPWQRHAVRLLRGMFSAMLGRTEQAEQDVRAALAGFRELGEAWGTAAALGWLGEFNSQRGDYETAFTLLAEARELGRICSWGDLAHLDGKLAAISLRFGDLQRARDLLARAERLAAPQARDRLFSDAWLGLIKAELLWREGDLPAAVRTCNAVVAAIAGRETVWWQSFRGLVSARLGVLELESGDRQRARAALAEAVELAKTGMEEPSLAAVLESVALYALCARPGRDGADHAARLLGAAAAIRGGPDESSLDGPRVRRSARKTLGAADFDAACKIGQCLDRDQAIGLARALTS